MNGTPNDDTLTGTAGVDDVIDGLEGNDTITGDTGNDTLSGGSGNDSVSGDDGNDTVFGNDGDDVLSGGTGSDSVDGGEGADIIDGGDGDDTLAGGDGDDILEGGIGADVIDGGAGSDTASYAGSSSAVTVDLALGTASGGDAQGDTLSNIENLTGSAHADTLTGDSNANTLIGGDGDDTLAGGDGDDILEGGIGADAIDGGIGNDTASYSGSSSGVTVNLDLGTASGGDAQGDTLSNIENLTGSAHADTLTGDNNANTLHGGDGGDTLIGGAGADILDGGAGNDTASYSDSSSGVTVNLDLGTASGGDAEGDVLSNIENLKGSAYADTLTGDSGTNVIEGGDGDDILNGGAGADTLNGGAGSDTYIVDDLGDVITGESATGAPLAYTPPSGFSVLGLADLTNDGSNHLLVTNGSVNEIWEMNGDTVASVLSLPFWSAWPLTGYVTEQGSVTGVLAEHSDGSQWMIDLDGFSSPGHHATSGNTADSFNGYFPNAEIDVVESSVDFTLSSHLENLTLTGTGDLSGTGNSGNNEIVGNTGDNVLTGAAGNDTLDGGLGADTLVGGEGSDSLFGGAGIRDVADYTASNAGVTVELSSAAQNQGGHAQGDVLWGVEFVEGSQHDDTVTGDAAFNLLNGHDGNDTLDGRLGNDTLIGGAGNDTLLGGGGNDTLVGGSGTDTLDGGDGLFDVADYSASSQGITVDLSLTTAQGGVGDAAGDTITDVEVVIGSDHNDTLTGRSGSDILIGGDGADVLINSAGDDQFFGGQRNQVGVGDLSDTVIFAGTLNDYEISFDGFTYFVEHTGTGEKDSLSGVRSLEFHDGQGGVQAFDLPILSFVRVVVSDESPAVQADLNIDSTLGVTYQLDGTPANVQLDSGVPGRFHYTPSSTSIGIDDFTVLATTNQGLTVRQTVPVDVFDSDFIDSSFQATTHNITDADPIIPSATNPDPIEEHANLLLPNGNVMIAGVSGDRITVSVIDPNGVIVGTYLHDAASGSGTVSLDRFVDLVLTETGDAILTWSALDGPNYDTFGLKLAVDGSAIGSASVLSGVLGNSTGYHEHRSDVVRLENGNLAMAVERSSCPNGTLIPATMGLVLFDENLNVIVQDQQINQDSSGFHGQPSIVALNDGGFVVFYHADSDLNGVGEVFARRYTEDGTAVGNEFIVNTFTDFQQDFPSVAALEDGRLVAVWRDGGNTGSSSDGFDIVGQIFEADGTSPIGTSFALNGEVDFLGFQTDPNVIALSDGGFAAVWESRPDESPGQPDTNRLLVIKRFDADGNSLGRETTLTVVDQPYEFEPKLIELRGGQLSVTINFVNPTDGKVYVHLAPINLTIGTVNADILGGHDGDDLFDGGLGNDRFYGGDGTDTVTYESYSNNITLDLDSSAAFHSDSGTDDKDWFSSVENIIAGSGDDTIHGSAVSNQLTGNAGSDSLYGRLGDDVLDGGDGADTLTGGEGNDILIAGGGDDVIIYNAGDGSDIIRDSGGADTLQLGAGVVLAGTALVENDFILTLGDGSTITIEDQALQNGIEVISGGNLVNDLVLTSNPTGDAGDNLILGTTGSDTLSGGAGSDILIAGDSNDVLDGGTGADTLIGGAGSDVYIVDHVGDSTIEKDEQVETLYAPPAGYTVLGHTDLTADGSDHILVTNGAVNEVWKMDGSSASATLSLPVWSGWTMQGYVTENGSVTGALYTKDSNGDQWLVELDGFSSPTHYAVSGKSVDSFTGYVFVTPDADIDVVEASVSHTLGDHIEHLTLTGSGDLSGTGNSKANTITGNSGNNTLTGGAGDDNLQGGSGDDVYVYALGDGSDVLQDTGGSDTLDLGTGVSLTNSERVADSLLLTLEDGSQITLDNQFLGSGIESVRGGNLASDVTIATGLNGGSASDLLTGTDADETLSGGAGDDALFGGHGADVLDGGAGADLLAGGTGSDTYKIDNIGDTVVEVANGVVPTTYSAPAGYTILGHTDLTGDGSNHILVKNSSVNEVWSMNGATVSSTLSLPVWSGWTMQGFVSENGAVTGALYTKDSNGDQWLVELDGFSSPSHYAVSGKSTDAFGGYIYETADTGIDHVEASVDHALESNVENLTLTGSGNLSGTGNSDANTITGNSGANTLSGGGGDDSLDGGSGDDVYVYANGDGSDVISDSGGSDTLALGSAVSIQDSEWSGDDLVLSLEDGSSIRIEGQAFGNGIETITGAGLTSSLSISSGLTGNAGNELLAGGNTGETLSGGAGNDALFGGGGDDTLDGGSGADTLAGGSGSDTYIIDNTGDVVIEQNQAYSATYTPPAGYTVLGHTDLTSDGSDHILVTNGSVNEVWEMDGSTVSATLSLPVWSGWEVLGYVSENGSVVGALYFHSGNSTQWLVELDGFSTPADYSVSGKSADAFSDYTYIAADTDVDLVEASVDHSLGNHVENLTLTGSGNISGTGNDGDNTITGNSGNNTLDGGLGDDTLALGAGSDTVLFASGDGNDIIADDGFDGSSTDTLDFAGSLTSDSLWLAQVGDDLRIDLLGSDDSVTLEGWFETGATADDRMDRIEAGGEVLVETNVQALVNAMATWSTANGGQDGDDLTEMPDDSTLAAALATAWQAS